uniref:Uncharacterized protein n=1 Tax=Anguilla anguilla TaxID=7936 RepID=A0A0E9PEB2_ANGAN
MAEMNHSC